MLASGLMVHLRLQADLFFFSGFRFCGLGLKSVVSGSEASFDLFALRLHSAILVDALIFYDDG